MVDPAWESVLGADLWQLIEACEPAVVRVAPLARRSAKSPADFMCELADGRRLRGRRIESPVRAREIQTIVRHVPEGLLPAVMGCQGAAVLEEWIDGRPGSQEALTEAQLAACGALLARLHGTRVSSAADPPPATRWLHDLVVHLGELDRRGVLDAATVRDVVGLARAHTPRPRVDTGVIHGDPCPRNLVFDEQDRPRLSGNETVRVDACDYDLARAWYRWPMSDRERAAFETGYSRERSLESFRRHFAFWALRVLVDSALYRSRTGAASVDEPVAAIRRLLADAPRGDAARDARCALRDGGAAYFASDFHLGLDGVLPSIERERSVVRWLETIAAGASDLFLLGDTFDVWFEYRRVVPKGYVRFLGALAALADAGTRVHVFTGNHDRLLGPYLEEEIGARVCRAPECRVLKGRTCYIGHGDDRAGATGRLAESPIIRRAVAAVHPDLGVRLIERTLAWRRRSPTVDTGAADRDESAAWDADVLRLVQAHPDVDCFVTGHRHRPQLVRVDDRVTYVDVGDWVTHQSFAVLDPQALRLETFDG